MKKVIYSILTLGFLVSCSSGGSDSPEPLSEQLIIGTWEMSEFSSDLQVYTLEDSVKNILLDTTVAINDKNELREIYDGVLPIWRFDDNGQGTNSEGDGFLWSLIGDQYSLEDCTGVYTGIFSIDSENLKFYEFGGEWLEYDTINQWWESQYLDITFRKIENNQRTQNNSETNNLKEFISKVIKR